MSMSDWKVEVKRIYPFENGDGAAVAGVVVAVGPVIIRARLMQGEDGLWLSLPGRRGKDDRWYYLVFFDDRSLHDKVMDAVLEAWDGLKQAA